MFETLILTLREGVEAALVVAIIVAFLRKRGQERYLGAVWSGLAAAVVASFSGAVVLSRVAVNEEVFEGLLYTASAVIVASMTIWMWRHAAAMGGEVRGSLGRILDRRRTWSVVAGLFVFTFLMVFREGVETVLFLSALSLATSTVLAWMGAIIGVGAAVAFGFFFVRGSLRIDLGRFFKVTGFTLLVFTVQLVLNGYHELSEAGWVPANATTMGLLGPLVRNEFFFVAAVVLLPLLLLVMPASEPRGSEEAAGGEGGGAAARLRRAAAARQRRARWALGSLGAVVLAVLGFGFAFAQAPLTLSKATPVTVAADGDVHLPLADFADEKLHRYVLANTPIRFIVIGLGKGQVVTGFDACKLCGAKGYAQDGPTIVCLHCHSAIYPPSIGQPGGCNPLPLPSRVVGDELRIAGADLRAGAAPFTAGHAHHHGG
jgi:high-affinity iron transporter